MDLDGDGNVDILSGSYSRMEGGMAGLFQVLWGSADGWREAEALAGTDGEPLILPGDDDDNVIDRICTRPTAVDLDADGDLDIVSGNFRGTFFVFTGEGEGKFAAEATPLPAAGKPVAVRAHSDPFFVDWDADGDQDMISGSSSGGVFLCANVGSKTEPSFAEPVELVAPVKRESADVHMGDAFLTEPQSSTRVFVDDLNGDGKLDLLVGDNVTLLFPAEGLDDDTAREKYAYWQKRQQDMLSTFDFSQGMDDEQMEAYQAAYEEFEAELKTIVRREYTGFVWALYGK